MTETSLALPDQFSAFLAGVKVAETVGSDLRAAITVETGLEEALQSAVMAGRDVVVAGSAGGGKTHLLRALDAQHATIEWPTDTSPGEEFVRMIPDATVVIDAIRRGGLADRPLTCLAQ